MAMAEVQAKDVRVGALVFHAGTHYRIVQATADGIAIAPAKYTMGLPPRSTIEPTTVVGCNPTDVLAPWRG